MAERLTVLQENILEYVRGRFAACGYPPSFREISKHCRIRSLGSVHYHIEALREKGFLHKDACLSRGIRLTPAAAGIPILGRVAAGIPLLAEENIEGYIEPATLMIGKKGMFALKVHGDSMIDAGIFEGDIAVVREQPTAADKDIVVALVNDEATIKYFYRDKSSVRLQPANPAYRPIQAKDIKILGKVVKIIRNY